LDEELNYIKNNVTERYVCSGDPTTRAQAITNALATLTGLTSGSFTGPADGDTSGRKVTKNAESGDGIDANGTAAVICYCSASALIWKVNLTATQALTSGGSVNVGAHKHEIQDAA
jgi:hypothetical protein